MAAILIEISILILTLFTIFILVISKNKKAEIIAMAATIAISIILELINENIFSQEGTYYPDSLLRFPRTDFPVFIPMISALYAVAISFSAIKIALFFRKHRFFISVASFFLLINTCFILEHFFTLTGYWVYKVPELTPLEIGLPIYFFYATLTVPAFAIMSFYRLKKKGL